MLRLLLFNNYTEAPMIHSKLSHWHVMLSAAALAPVLHTCRLPRELCGVCGRCQGVQVSIPNTLW